MTVGRPGFNAPLFSNPRRPVLVLWAIMAAVNLTAGVVLAARPERASDLETIERFGREWLLAGSNIYAPTDSGAVYPPYAVVALSPLALFPAKWAVPGWTVLNLALAVVAPFLAVRVVRPAATLSDAALPMLMFLCWGGVRTLLQFSLLTLTVSLLAMVLADKRPLWSGVCFGLAMMKPQMAIPALAWALFTRRLRPIGVAAALTTAGFALFCLRARAEPVSVVVRYTEILKLLYLGDARVVGLANVRQLLALAVSSTPKVDALSIAIAIAMLLAIGILGFREGKRRDAVMYSAPPLVGIWSLLTFYHLTYGFIVLLPTAMALLFANELQTARLRKTTLCLLQFGLMVDLPGVWRRIGPLLTVPDVVNAAVPQFDRVLMLAIFGSVATLYARTERARLEQAVTRG